VLVVKLTSGLGNQLFIYSFAMYLKQETKSEVYFDLSSFQRDVSKRVPEIDILFPLLNNSVSLKWLYNGRNYLKRKIYSYIFSHSNKINIHKDFSGDIKLKDADGVVIDYFKGYWQTDFFVNKLTNKFDYFKPNASIPNELLLYFDQIKNSPISVSLHVRRGDYFTKRYAEIYGVCDVIYYQKALEFIESQVNSFTLFVFSDDLNWVKSNLNFNSRCFNTIFVDNFQINSFWYINLMSNCTHNIISNSTFSWWGAYLNKGKDKIVITPSKWRQDSEESIALKEWVHIHI
jgi:hypothetical protein